MIRVRLLAALVLGVLGVLALPAGPASAHAALVRTSPVQGTVLQQAPSEVVVTFSEPVGLVRDKIQVIGPDGKRIDKGDPTVSGDDVRIPVRTDVRRGTYLVSYRVISADNHPVGAGFTYSLGAASTTPPRPSDSTAGRTDRAVAMLLSAARWLGYVGLILLAGPALILLALWPNRLPRRGPTRLAYLGLGLVAGSALFELYLQAPYQNGGSLFSPSAGDLGDVLSGSYGTLHLVRLAALALAVPLLRSHLAGRAGKPAQVALAILAVVAVATWPLSGHPATTTAPLLTIVADAAHLVSMAIWLGGLVMLVGFLLRRANAKELDAILPVWSNWATLAVTVLVLAGTSQALINVATVGALLHTTYGTLLLLKIGVLAVVLAGAAVARRLVRRQAADKPQGVRRLRFAVFAEIAGAVLILGLTSALVQTTPARTAAASPAGSDVEQDIFSTTLDSKLYQLQLDIEPLTVGNSDVHLYAFTPDGKSLTVKEWKVTAALPDKGVQGIDVPVLALTPSHATGTVSLPTAGRWQFSFTLRTTDFDEATVTTEVTIK
ncbi:MAG: copper resistance protein CopC [Actinobacteria bacterium 13_1_20CM_3_71_11]|nr:MAG: copper resistance protein CopC [Actinobacteria bacterium 13_1_20CM_3_71_11]